MTVEFQVSYRLKSKKEQTKLALENLRTLDLNTLMYFRRVWTTRRQGHTPGFFWFSSLNKHVYYESYLEKRCLTYLDYLGDVQTILEQPLALHFDGKTHIPDFLVKNQTGQHCLIDVKLKSRLEDERVQNAFRATAEAVGQIGWLHDVMSEREQQFEANLDWLSSFRRPIPQSVVTTDQLMQTLQPGPLEFGALIEAVGEPMLTKPVLFQLIWQRVLLIDLHMAFTNRSVIQLA